ncbi:MAG TPA: ABC transporter ATP-binding protein [Longimicrobiales bacterium]|nr:ABC transporter ATP-binding protein [Longimicrobiales bacterium]
MAAAIRTRALTRDFGPVRALDHLDLEVEAGSIFGFLGPNGAGKTTTIRILLGLLEATSGSAEVLGFDAARDADRIREAAGALLEHAGIYERLSAEKNLDLFGRIYRLPARERKARAHELLDSFGLAAVRQRRAGALSRGMKQKLAIARAMLHRPRLLFLDEPTAGLDPAAAASLRDDLLALARQERVTVFLTTHNLDEAERLCDQVAVIHRGVVRAAGSPAELRERAGRPRVRIRAAGLDDAIVRLVAARPEVAAAACVEPGVLEVELRDGARPAPIVALLVRSGAEVDEVRRLTPSLEAAYLELVEPAP